jgi:hypothetical protein
MDAGLSSQYLHLSSALTVTARAALLMILGGGPKQQQLQQQQQVQPAAGQIHDQSGLLRQLLAPG